MVESTLGRRRSSRSRQTASLWSPVYISCGGQLVCQGGLGLQQPHQGVSDQLEDLRLGPAGHQAHRLLQQVLQELTGLTQNPARVGHEQPEWTEWSGGHMTPSSKHPVASHYLRYTPDTTTSPDTSSSESWKASGRLQGRSGLCCWAACLAAASSPTTLATWRWGGVLSGKNGSPWPWCHCSR